jgi:hypothetical protein
LSLEIATAENIVTYRIEIVKLRHSRCKQIKKTNIERLAIIVNRTVIAESHRKLRKNKWICTALYTKERIDRKSNLGRQIKLIEGIRVSQIYRIGKQCVKS